MNLCIVTPRVIKGDGQGRANYEVVLEAIRRGYYITLIATEVDQDLSKHQQITWISISVSYLPTALLRNIVFSYKTAAWLRRYGEQFDLIQVNGCVTSVPGHINAVHFVHSNWMRSPSHISRDRQDLYGLYQWIYTTSNAYWEKKSFQRSELVIAVSNQIKQQLIDIGVAATKIQVVFNGVDLYEFSPGEADRYKLNLPEGATLALFVGDIRTSRKNLDTILHALVYVSDLHLVVVGATEGSPYPRLATNLALEDRVHFLGYRLDVPEIMRASDFFVFPSRYEACTLVLLEAMASGLPVITAATTGGSEIVTPECGFVLSNSEDVIGLSQALKYLKENPGHRHQMGCTGRTIAEQYSWKDTAQKYLNLFEQFINSNHYSKQTSLV